MRKIVIIMILSLLVLCACSDTSPKDKPKEKLTLEKIKEDNSLIYGKWNGNVYNATMSITESEVVGVALEIEILYKYEGGHTMTYELIGRYDKNNDSIYCYGNYTRTMYYADGKTEEEVKSIDYHMEISEDAVVRFGDTLFEKDGYESSIVEKETTKKNDEHEFTEAQILDAGRQYIGKGVSQSSYAGYEWEYVKDMGVSDGLAGNYIATYQIYFPEKRHTTYIRINLGIDGNGKLYYVNSGI